MANIVPHRCMYTSLHTISRRSEAEEGAYTRGAHVATTPQFIDRASFAAAVGSNTTTGYPMCGVDVVWSHRSQLEYTKIGARECGASCGMHIISMLTDRSAVSTLVETNILLDKSR